MATRAPRNPLALTPSKGLATRHSCAGRNPEGRGAGRLRLPSHPTPPVVPAPPTPVRPEPVEACPEGTRRGPSTTSTPRATSALRTTPPTLRITLTRPYCPHSTPPLPSPHGTRMQHPRTAHRHHLRAMALPARTVRIDARVRFRPRQPEVVSHGRKSWDQYFISRTKAPATTTPTKQPPATARPAFRRRRQSKRPPRSGRPRVRQPVLAPRACATRAGVRNSAQPKPRR